MRKIILLITVFAWTNLSFAQEADFTKYIVKNRDWKETPETVWKSEINAAKGSLHYFGAQHLDFPTHPQFEEIKKAWIKFKPTIAFYEGPDRGIAESDTLTIKKFGESGYVRFLAAQTGIPTKTLEPSPVVLYHYLCTQFDQEKVDVYMLTKEAMRLRTRKNYSQKQIEEETTKLLMQFQQMLGKTIKITSVAALENSFKKYFDGPLNWWELPPSWFDPQSEDARFTNQLATRSTEYRDIFMVGILAEQINKGEKVFAVVGRNHVPLQINAIKYAVGLPIKKTK